MAEDKRKKGKKKKERKRKGDVKKEKKSQLCRD